MNWTKEKAEAFLKASMDVIGATHKFFDDLGATFGVVIATVDDLRELNNEADLFLRGEEAGYIRAKYEDLITPNQLQHMTWDEANGGYVSTPGWESDIAALRFRLPNVRYGSKVRVSFTRTGIFPRTGNIKFLRCWNDLSGVKYPNFYVGQPDAGKLFVYTELLTPFDSKTNHPYLDPLAFPFGDGVPHNEVYSWTYPSAFGLKDGRFTIVVDGKVALDCLTWQCEGPGTGPDGKAMVCQGLPFDLFIQTDPSNQVFPAGSYVKIKGVDISITS